MIIDQRTRERFWSKVKKGALDECWEWQGSCYPTGYGQFWFRKRNQGAHRISMAISGHKIIGRLVCHSCDNPSCVNPNHLFLGTHKDNTQDMILKGRQNKTRNKEGFSRGSDHYLSKVTEEDVSDIRKRYKKGKRGFGVRVLAKEYRVDPNAIYSIVNYITWRHVK